MSPRIINKVARYGAVTVLALMTAVCGIYLATYQKAKSALLSDSLIADTAVGPIEYLQFGAGPAVAIVHGTPGGYDQFKTWASVIADAGYRVVVYSRPGYLRTPLAVGESVAEQAAALDAVRAHLMID